MQHLESILKELSFVFPEISLSEISVSELMDFNLHNLEDQFRKDLLLTSFFSMLEVDISHKLAGEENAWKDLENELSESIRASSETKVTDARLKILVQMENAWKLKRDLVENLSYQLESVRSVVKDLSRKGITLNVLTAKNRAELGAGITH